MVPETGLRAASASVPAPTTPAEIAVELTQAVHDLNARGLYKAAQWAAEQLVGLELHASPAPPQQPWGHAPQLDPQQPGAASSRSEPAGPCPRADADEWHPQYLLARAHFQAKEYRRCAHALGALPGPLPTFLRLHALYLAGEKRKEEERVERGGLLGRGGDVANPELEGLAAALEAALGIGPAAAEGQLAAAAGIREDVRRDPFLLYLYGLVLSDRGRTAEALEVLARSLTAYPANWSAWQAVQATCIAASGGGGAAGASAPPAGLALPNGAASTGTTSGGGSGPGGFPALPAGLPVHWAREFFLSHLCLACHQNQEALSRLQGLAQVFRGSLAVEGCVAQAHYNLQNYDDAQALYEDLLARDPYRIEGTDTLSNILFVKEAHAPLSVLAHRLAATDKYRPETCCVLGNYYSLQGLHEKAVEYFRRALRLDPRCLAAWTLMGHEYMEIKNTSAAIDAYRRAVDVSPQDFRAWYGLGQAYELLKMPFYALYYYRRAAQLKPTDARMWSAVAQCYVHEAVGLQDAAIRAYQRAVANNDPDGIAVHKLAKLYESRHEPEAAEQLFRYSLMRLEAQGAGAALHSQDAIEALSFLATHCKDTGRLEEAEELCARLMDVGGPAKERAKALAKEIRSRQQQQQQQGSQGGAGAAAGTGAGPGQQLALVPGGGATAMDADASPYGSPYGRTAGAGLGGGGRGMFRGGGGGGVLGGSDGGLLGGPSPEECGGCDPLAVMAVMQQLQYDTPSAVALLHRSGGDPVAAVRAAWYPGGQGAAGEGP